MSDRGTESGSSMSHDQKDGASVPTIRSLWDFSNPAESEARFRQWRDRVHSHSVEAVELQTQVARALGLQGRFDDGLAALDVAKAMPAATTPLAQVRLLLEHGRLLNSFGRAAEALPIFRAAHELAKSSGFGALAIDAGHMVAIALPNAVDQIAWNTALFEDAVASSESEVRRWSASLANNLAWALFDQKNLTSSLQWHERALELFRERGDADAVRIARWSVAKLWRIMGRVQPALAEQQAILHLLKDSNRTDGFVHEEIGECLLALGAADESREHFRLAHEELSKIDWMKRDEPARIERLAQLGAL
jgi:tetratricopeptide (TPR) repeat protein